MSREVLCKILVDLGIEESLIVDEAHLFADLEIDSTEAVEVSLSLKKELGVSLRLDGGSDPRIKDLCAVIEGARAKQAAAAAVGDAE